MTAQRAKTGSFQRYARPTARYLGRVSILIAVLLLLSASLSCAIIPSGVDSEATASPDSSGDILTFQLPVSVLTLEPGETIPHTQLTYEGHEGSIYRVLIDNQPADKRVGDSFRWQGVIAPGITAHYNLRIAPTFLQDNLLLGGSVEIGVFNPIPIELEGTLSSGDELLHFNNIFVDYRVPVGEMIPGTTIRFLGQKEQEAELSGVVGYPYRAAGDSVTWQGRLRGNTDVRYSLRVISINEDELRVMGSAELWIDPRQE